MNISCSSGMNFLTFFNQPVLTLHLTPVKNQKNEEFPPSFSKLTSEARPRPLPSRDAIPRPLPSRVTSRAGTASAPSGTAGTEGNGKPGQLPQTRWEPGHLELVTLKLLKKKSLCMVVICIVYQINRIPNVVKPHVKRIVKPQK